MERTKVKIVNHSIQNTYRIVRWNILIYSLWEKDDLIGIVRTKMYLCHITLLMLKDTKSLGNNNASAWESRGVVIKKEGMHFDTPSDLKPKAEKSRIVSSCQPLCWAANC